MPTSSIGPPCLSRVSALLPTRLLFNRDLQPGQADVEVEVAISGDFVPFLKTAMTMDIKLDIAYVLRVDLQSNYW